MSDQGSTQQKHQGARAGAWVRSEGGLGRNHTVVFFCFYREEGGPISGSGAYEYLLE